MSKIKITCDSTCDLTRELYEACGADVLPLGVSLGEDFRRDGVDVDPKELFAYVEKTGELPKTSAMSPGEYEELFRKWTEQGFEVIHISLSDALSASHRNAVMAAGEVGNVHVVDSSSLSSGSGLLVLLAAELAEQGLRAEQIVEQLNDKKKLLDVSFVLQTLDYLHKGGRCSGLTSYGANLLKLRPEIQVVDGQMQVGRKYRGEMEKSILAYIRGQLEGRTDLDLRRIFVTHSGVPDEIVQKAIELVWELQPFEEVIETKAGCTIASHCGPNCLGVLFLKQN